MKYKNFGTSIYVRFDKGDEILSKLEEVCKNENIKAASVSGIGGCGEIVVGTYNLEKKDYIIEEKSGLFEMISLTGNVTLDEKDNPYIHAHAIFSYIDDNNKSCIIGGHLKKAVILLTGEIVINPVNNEVIKRVKDASSALNIWDL